MPFKFNCLNKHNLLTILTVIGVLAGTITGLILTNVSDRQWTKREVMYLKFPGDIFLRMLKALIVPLLTSSVISAIGALDLSLSRKIAIRSIIYYSTTTVCAVILGIILVWTIRPGVGGSKEERKSHAADQKVVLTADTLMDLGR